MSTSTMTKTGAILGTALLVGAAGAAFAPAIGTDAPAAFAQESAQDVAVAKGATVGAERLEGTFAYNQDVVSSSAQIRGIFCKAAATLCASLPQYGTTTCGSMLVSGPNGPVFDGVLGQGDSDDSASSHIIGCSCATNAAGGGAIVNADVSGTAVATLAAMLAM